MSTTVDDKAQHCKREKHILSYESSYSVCVDMQGLTDQVGQYYVCVTKDRKISS